MMSHYSTDTTALKRRAELNDKGAQYNLEDWIIQQVKPYRGMSILESWVRYRENKSSVSQIMFRDGFILGLDISPR